MPAHNPEELDDLFATALNSGDLDALVALYEPRAILFLQPGQSAAGTTAIREGLSVLLSTKPKMLLKPKTIALTGDIALTSASWEVTRTGPDGAPVTVVGRSAEVSRRQADGTWLFVIDLPRGLEL
jgi:uncharacterized protein (TIGR02246 family)